MKTWHQLSATAACQQFGGVDPTQGLSATDAHNRQLEQGANELIEQPPKSPWVILWEQLTATMVLILIVAAVLSAMFGELQDTAAILIIVVFNALLGIRQEYQAERAIASLRQLAVPEVRVRREGQVQSISARDLVPGDIVLLEAGNIVPADGRVMESVNLRIQESSLTGEADAIAKQTPALPRGDLPLAERQNMAYMGTVVTYGRGTVLITETGMATELGQIATAIQAVNPKPTHLQERLDQLGKGLAIAILIIVLVVFGLGLLRGEPLQAMFLFAVSLGVAAVPEGLPAVVTIALSLGAQRMLKQQALIRKLPAVETLGAITVICSDKTGTLTENQMAVTTVAVAGDTFDLGQYRQAIPRSQPIPLHPTLKTHPGLLLLLLTGTLCNDAALQPTASWQYRGEPTEGALLIAAAQMGLHPTDLQQYFPRMAEVPFDSHRKRMTTIHPVALQTDTDPLALLLQSFLEGPFPDHPTQPVTHLAFCKGALDPLLARSTSQWGPTAIEPLTPQKCDRIREQHDKLADQGLRLLGMAFRPLAACPEDPTTVEQHLIFVGLVGMIDPIRADVYGAVQTCQTAGIQPVMITGDHPITAQAIAATLGINPQASLLTGQMLDRLSAEDLHQQAAAVTVYARVTPQHKLDIVKALQDNGHIVAMTGDGVNDAPALKQADIGVAMGQMGTDVAKDAADMVLLDDNFSTIVAATREGRVIYDNIRKFIQYTLTGNLGELWVILIAPFLGMPLPLLPLQILWINLIADGFLALSLSVEPAERQIMQRSPYHPQESIFARGMGLGILWIGTLLGILLLGVAYGYWQMGLEQWQTMVFCTLAFSRMTIAQAVRSDQDLLYQVGLFSNRPALLAVLLTLFCQLMVVYSPLLQVIFATVPLSTPDLGICVGLGLLIFAAVELKKLNFKNG